MPKSLRTIVNKERSTYNYLLDGIKFAGSPCRDRLSSGGFNRRIKVMNFIRPVTYNCFYRNRVLTHQSIMVWRVIYSFCRLIFQECQIFGGHYSRTQKKWWSADEVDKELLSVALPGEPISPKRKTRKEEKPSVDFAISHKIKEKIREIEVWMRLKRYSQNTVNTYIIFLRQFFTTRPDLNWDSVKTGDITKYNFDYFISGRKSPETTMIYTHLSGKDLRAIRSSLDDMKIWK